MAENLDNPSFGGNFGIQDTMEMGMGNAELLNDLAEEHDLTEEETQQVLDELFGIGSTLKSIGSKIAHPFKLVHAGFLVRMLVPRRKLLILRAHLKIKVLLWTEKQLKNYSFKK